MALLPQGLCVVAVLRLSPWGYAVSQKTAEGFGQSSVATGGTLPAPMPGG